MSLKQNNKMKGLITSLLIGATTVVIAQSNQVQNANNYLRSKEYDLAKKAADAAITNESTKGSPKLWMYRGLIYEGIYESKKPEDNKLDDEAQEKAVESFITCLKLDKDNIYKDQMKGNLVVAGAALDYKVKYYLSVKNYDKALKGLDLLEQALPYDFDLGLKRNNVTKENLLFSHFNTYSFAGNKDKMIEYANKLIEIKYKDPTIYTRMVKICLIDKDTTKALSFIDKGKLLFEDNMDLISQEIDIYLKQNKTDILKSKLVSAIDLAPDNEVLHLVLGNIYDKTNDQENAEKEYLKAIEIKPEYELANYNLGALYFKMGNQWNEKINALPLSETKKAKEFEDKKLEFFRKATGYLEKSYATAPDAATKQRLRQLFLKLGETEKADKYK